MIITAHRNPIYCQVGQEPFEGLFEYGLIPSLGDVNLERYLFSLNALKKMNSGKLEFGLDYSALTFSFYDYNTSLSTDSYENTHTFQTKIGYHQDLGKKWVMSISLSPMLSSNFKNGPNSEDFIFNWSTSFSKEWGNGGFPISLTVGLGRGVLFGEPGLFPILSLRGKMAPEWDYLIGFPYSAVSYKINGKQSLSTKAVVSGTYANNSETVIINGLEHLGNTKLAYSEIDLGLEYNYRMSSGFTTVVRAGFSTANSLEVLDNNDNPLFDFKVDPSPYIIMGLTYSLNVTNKLRK